MMMKNILLILSLLSLLACHPVLSKEISIILSEENNSTAKNKVFTKLDHLLNQSLVASEKCRALAEHSLKSCLESFFLNKNFLYGSKLLSDLSDHRHLLNENDRKKFDVLSKIDNKIDINIIYVNNVGSLVLAEQSVITIKAVLQNHKNNSKENKEIRSTLASALESVEEAKQKIRKTKEMSLHQ